MKNTNLFRRVEIEINTHCNKENDTGKYCTYCPNSVIKPLPPRLIQDSLYIKIINELNELDFVGRLSFHFYGEPLLHPRVEFLINYAKNHLSEAELVMYTNGDKLNDSKYKSLITAGIDIIAIHNPHKNFPLRPKQKILNTIHLTNRGGLLGKTFTLNLKCFVPTYRLVIGYNGDVLLCYEDVLRHNILGNINNKTIKEIWFSDKFFEIRYNLSNGYRKLYIPCKYCNNRSHTDIGQINVNHFYNNREYSVISYLKENKTLELKKEISLKGFVRDELLVNKKDCFVYGINVAAGWPLPTKLQKKYEDLFNNLIKYNSCIYIYPYEQTHITILTIINFKDHINPSQDHLKKMEKIRLILNKKIEIKINELKSTFLKPFIIDIGHPVLSSNSIFLPILNATNEIEKLRDILGYEIEKELNLKILRPTIIHCTIGRFINKIKNKNHFVRDFERIFSKHVMGKAKINEILLTSETKPYMRDGKILHRYTII